MNLLIPLLFATVVPVVNEEAFVFTCATNFSLKVSDRIVQNGPVSNLCWGAVNSTIQINGQVHFRGGFFTGKSQLAHKGYPTTLSMKGTAARAWIEEVGVHTPGVAFNQAEQGEVVLNAADNEYAAWKIRHGTLVCGAAGVLNPDSKLIIWNAASTGSDTAGTLDLAGYDQTTAELSSTSTDCIPANFVTSSSRDAKLVAKKYLIGGVEQAPGWYGSCVVVPNADGSLPEKPVATYPTYRPSRDIRIVHTRGGVGNFLAKCRAGGSVNVAYFGGSITAMDGWRNLTTAWLREQYPAATINEIAASIGGTGSDLGVFRLKADVLDKDPDLVFVEFAVNDGITPTRSIWRQMEGIVRQIWAHDGTTDIIFCYTVAGGIFNEYAGGKYNRSAAAMEQVAEFYDIPSISLGVPAVQLFEQDDLVVSAGAYATAVPTQDADYDAKVKAAMGLDENTVLFANDGVHPRAEGHALYRIAVTNAFDALSAIVTGNHSEQLASAFVADHWQAAKVVDVTPAILRGAWSADDDYAGVYKTETPGAKMHFAFDGLACRLRMCYQPDGGIMNTTIDGEAVADIVGFDQSSTYVRDGSVDVFDGEDGVHTVEMTLSAEQPDRTILASQFDDPDTELAKDMYNGTVFRARQLLLVGDLVEAYDRTIDDSNYADYTGQALTIAEDERVLIRLSQSVAVTFAGTVSGAGELVVENAGTASIVFSGSFTGFTGTLNATGNVQVSGGNWNGMQVNGMLSGLSLVHAGGGKTLRFDGANVVRGDTPVTIGHGAGPSGVFDLNGYDQTLSRIGMEGSAYPTTHASYAQPTYAITSASAATMTVTNAVVFPASVGWPYPKDGRYRLSLTGAASFAFAGEGRVTFCGASTTTGSLIARAGTIEIDREATFSNGARLEIENTGTFEVPDGFAIETLKVDGTYVVPGSYDAAQVAELTGGRLTGGAVTVKTRVIGEVTTYTWVGGGTDDSLSTAANWQSGVAPKLKGGDEKLVFSTAGTATAAGMLDIYGLELSAGVAFALTTSNEGRLAIPAAQSWSLPADATLTLHAPLAGTGTVTESGNGRIVFASDATPTFTGRLMMADGATVELAGAGGIGADGSYLDLPGAAGLKVTGTCVTNRTAMTFAHGGAQTWSPAGSEVYFLGAITNNTSGGRNSNILVDGRLHLRGGLYCSAAHRANPSAYIWWWWKFCIHPTTGEAWIENKPIDVGGCGVYLQQRSNGCGRLHLGVAGNTFGRIVTTFGSTIICDVPDALCATGDVDDYNKWVGFLNLNGCDQTIRDLRMQDSVNGGGKPMLGYNGQINSSQPAVLTITGANAGTPAAFRFMDRAGLHYAGTGALVLSNETSTSTGPLKVSSGELRLCRGATWANCTNVVVTGTGKLTLDAAVAHAKPFSTAATLTIGGDGQISIPSDETVTVTYLKRGDEFLPSGTYTDGFVTGGGTLKVLRSHRGFMFLIK